jgi:arylsulfatase A-like enzyme
MTNGIVQFGCLAALLAGAVLSAQEPWPQLNPSTGAAFQKGSSVIFRVADTSVRTIQFPRLNNVIRRVTMLDGDAKHALTLRQNPTTWNIPLPTGRRRPVEIILDVEGVPFLPTKPKVVSQDARGTITLPAHHAVVHGEKMCFEPQPHKNTLGFWVNPKDWAEWHVQVDRPGAFDVVIWQGCGSGQGGSTVELSIAGQALEFVVEETGHFQCFRRRSIGTVQIKEPGSHRLQVRPRARAKGAVMDLRRVELVPATKVTPTKKRTRANVLIFFADDQGTLDAGCYGSRDLFTPNIDGLAAAGTRMTQAYSHTVCCPARALLLTGRHPQRGGVNQWTQGDMHSKPGRNMHLDEVTIAEVLGKAGYRTGIVGKWHLGAAATHGPTKQGFDEFFGLRGGFIDNYNHHFLHGKGFHDLYRNTKEVFERGEYFPDLVVREANSFLDRNKDRPFFLYVAFNVPHYPEQADEKFDLFYARHKMPRQSYGKMVSTTDDRIGQVMGKLEQLGLRDDTLVVFMSDNGHSAERSKIRVDNHSSGLPKGHDYGANGGGGNTGKWRGNKGTFFEGGLRVPMIVSFPGRLPQGAVRDQAVTAADVFPTILDVCGIEPPEVKFDGASLVPILRDAKAKTHHDVMHWQWFDRWAVREGGWKLIHDTKLRRRGGLPFLGNLDDAAPEKKNYASEKPALVQRLTALHDAWAKNVRGE